MYCYLNHPNAGLISLVAFSASEGAPHIIYQGAVGSLFIGLFNAVAAVSNHTRSDFSGETYPVASSIYPDSPEAKEELIQCSLLHLHPLITTFVDYTGKDSVATNANRNRTLLSELVQIYNDIAAYFFGYLSVETMLMESEPYNKEFHHPGNIYLAAQSITETTATAYLQAMHQIYSSPTICDIKAPAGYDVISRLFDDDGHPRQSWDALVHQKIFLPVFSLYRIAALDLWAADTLGLLTNMRICPYCGKIYAATNPIEQVYCSNQCKSRHHESKNWPFRTGHDTVGEFLRNAVNADYCKKAEELLEKLDICDRLPGQKLREYARADHDKHDTRFLCKQKDVLLGVIKKLPAYPYYYDISEARSAWMQFDKTVKAHDKFKAEAEALRRQACDAESDRLKEHIEGMETDAKNGFYGPWYYEEKRNPLHRKDLSALWTNIKKKEGVR